MLFRDSLPALLLLFPIGLGLAPFAHAGLQSVDHVPGFTYFQRDPVFDNSKNIPAHGKLLCGPAALAQSASVLRKFHEPPFPGLLTAEALRSKTGFLPDVASSPVRTGGDWDWTSFVAQLSQLLHTDDVEGTRPNSMLEGIGNYLALSGYSHHPYVKRIFGPGVLLSPFPTDRGVPPTLRELRTYLERVGGFGVIVQVGFYLDGEGGRVAGHLMSVHGYDYDASWGESRIFLKVVNTSLDYSLRDAAGVYDEIELTSREVAPLPGNLPRELTHGANGNLLSAPVKSVEPNPKGTNAWVDLGKNGFTDNSGLSFELNRGYAMGHGRRAYGLVEGIFVFLPELPAEYADAADFDRRNGL